MTHNLKEFCTYMANYIEEELTRNNAIESDTIQNAIDAFCGGAHDGETYKLEIVKTL